MRAAVLAKLKLKLPPSSDVPHRSPRHATTDLPRSHPAAATPIRATVSRSCLSSPGRRHFRSDFRFRSRDKVERVAASRLRKAASCSERAWRGSNSGCEGWVVFLRCGGCGIACTLPYATRIREQEPNRNRTGTQLASRTSLLPLPTPCDSSK